MIDKIFYVIWLGDDSDLVVGNREARCWMLGAPPHSRSHQDNPRHRQGIHHPEVFNLDLIIINIFDLIIIIIIIIQTILVIDKASIILRIKILSSSLSIFMIAMIVSKLWHWLTIILYNANLLISHLDFIHKAWMKNIQKDEMFSSSFIYFDPSYMHYSKVKFISTPLNHPFALFWGVARPCGL